MFKTKAKLKLYFFHKIFLPCIVYCKRKKKQVRVLFVLQYLAEWKTEPLYREMLKHPRIVPIIGITPCIEIPGEENKVRTYCQSKKYDYVELSPHETLSKQVHPDFVIHQKPYGFQIHGKHYIQKNKSIPCVMIPYGIHTTTESWSINTYLSRLCWIHCFENKKCCDESKNIHIIHGCNFVVTGLPAMDELLQKKVLFPNPWPTTNGKKKIIYAPHHSIADMHAKGIAFSTFLENGEFMLEMLNKYEDDVYFVFKPHPILYRNLVRHWGKDKTEAYYNRWRSAKNSHIEDGEYIGLFKHSDAMIHDCGTFMVEYMYTGNPVMYLIRNEYHEDNLSQYVRKAFNLHYKGRTHADIEQFIQDVIAGSDPLKQKRRRFYEEQLQPPYGKTACENIINAILGIEEYKSL